MWEQGLLSALRLMWELFDMNINLFLALRCVVQGVYLVMERSLLTFSPGLEHILPHPCVLELLRGRIAVSCLSFQRG